MVRLLCLIAMLVGLMHSLALGQVKLVHFGWDNQRIENIGTLSGKLKASAFDGLTLSATSGSNVFMAQAIPDAEFEADLAVLKSIDVAAFADSYLAIHAATDGVFDWLNDGHWATSLSNIRNQVKLAKAGGFKGIVFDMEPYGKSPWDYKSQAANDKLTFTQFEKLVQRRSESMMAALQEVDPGLDVWCLYGLSAVTWLLEEPESLTNREKVLQHEGYGLWPAFFGGLAKAAKGNTRVIEGNEPSYYYTRAEEFRAAENTIRDDLARFLRPELRETYRQKIQIGHAVYLDGIMNLHKSPRFIGYYLQSEADRLALLQSNTQKGLAASDTLVWVYAEKARWWDAPPDAALNLALRRAKSSDSSLSAVAIAAAADAWKNRVSVGGKILDRDGKPVAFGTQNIFGESTACSAFGDQGAYSCEFPRGSTQVVAPSIEGRKVVPADRTFENLQTSDWNVNWVVE
jgi:hypothetical protein